MAKTIATQKSPIADRGDGMTDEGPLPSSTQLGELLDKLLPENDQLDSISASIILEREGIDRAWLAGALRSRLSKRIEGMHARGEDIPAPLAQLMKVVESKVQTQEVEIDAETWVESVLSGQFPQIPGQLGQRGLVQAFRPRATQDITDEDLEVLREMAIEIDERAKERE
jgi:hypothetical protein